MPAEQRREWSWHWTALVPAVLAIPLVASAGEAQRPREALARRVVESMWIAPRAELAPISPGELIDGSNRHAVPVASGRLVPPPPTTVLRREIPAVWEARIPAGLPLDQLEIDYELVGEDGRRSRLSPFDGSDDEIPVRLLARPPVFVRHEGSSSIVRGGVLLEMDVRDVRRAGRYAGRLVVHVNGSRARL